MTIQLQHRVLTNTALPYITNESVISGTPRFVAGSNVKTSISGFSERRPGFPTYTADNYSTDKIRRFHTFRRWGADFYAFLVEVESAACKVYKQRVGTDATFVLIHTDSVSTEPFDFAVSANHIFFGNGTDMKKYDGTTVTNWGITAPAAAVGTSLAAGALSPTIGYKYVIAWENDTTGHISSPSPLMAAYVVPVAQNVTITGNTTTDAQVDRVRIYRTTDGGSIYFEHPSSPITYATWTGSGLADSSADTALKSTIAPLQSQNNRPTAGKCAKWFAGRLWVAVGDKVYYSGWEEIPLGTSDMPEECFPIDNYFPFGQEVIGLGVAGDPVTGGSLIVLCDGGIHAIDGDSLDTFKRRTIARKGRGLRNRACVTEHNKLVVWLDASNTVQYTDGHRIEELSVPIRPDLASITHASAALTSHDDGVNHWLLLMDGGNSKLLVFDTDAEQWMVPWDITSMEAIYSGETAAGTWKLLLGRGGKPLAMNLTTYQDEGSNYAASATLGLIDIVLDKPDSLGSVVHVGVERNSVANSAVGLLTDEDPSGATYTALASISGNPVDPWARTNGTNLVEKQYKTENGPIARRASVKLEWAAANSNFKTYSVDIAYTVRPQ